MKLNKEQLTQDLEDLLIPVADYDFEIIASEKKKSDKTTDGEMFKLTVVIEVDGRLKKIKTVLGQWLKGGAKSYKGFLDAVGLDDDGDYSADELLGLTGKLHNRHGAFNGKPQDEVHWWVPLKPGQKSPARISRYTATGNSNEAEDDNVPF